MALFRARARTLDMLGRQQIAGIPTAISELFKNAHDAYAVLHGQRLLILSGDASIETGADCFVRLLPLAKNLLGFPDDGPLFFGHFTKLSVHGRRVSFSAMRDSS